MTTTPVEQASLPPFSNQHGRCPRCARRGLDGAAVRAVFGHTGAVLTSSATPRAMRGIAGPL
jgi:hypothetical protein